MVFEEKSQRYSLVSEAIDLFELRPLDRYIRDVRSQLVRAVALLRQSPLFPGWLPQVPHDLLLNQAEIAAKMIEGIGSNVDNWIAKVEPNVITIQMRGEHKKGVHSHMLQVMNLEEVPTRRGRTGIAGTRNEVVILAVPKNPSKPLSHSQLGVVGFGIGVTTWQDNTVSNTIRLVRVKERSPHHREITGFVIPDVTVDALQVQNLYTSLTAVQQKFAA